MGDAIKKLIDNSISGVPVVNAANEIVGILSEKDLLKVFYVEDGKPLVVGTFMTPDPVSFDVNAPLVEIFDCLMANDFRRVLIHENDKLVGLISRADLMPAILEALLQRSAA